MIGWEFIQQKESIIKEYNPYYLQCSVESSDIQLIHTLENEGFRFIEFRVIKVMSAHDFIAVGTNTFYPYQLHAITNDSQITKIEKLLVESYSDDRFSGDPLIKKNISKASVLTK